MQITFSWYTSYSLHFNEKNVYLLFWIMTFLIKSVFNETKKATLAISITWIFLFEKTNTQSNVSIAYQTWLFIMGSSASENTKNNNLQLNMGKAIQVFIFNKTIHTTTHNALLSLKAHVSVPQCVFNFWRFWSEWEDNPFISWTWHLTLNTAMF